MSLKPCNTLIEVDRKRYSLRLWKRDLFDMEFEQVKRYPVAIGMQGYGTPAGFYCVQKKGKNVDWRMPDSEWVQPPELRGTIVPGGDPANPIVARWIQLTSNGVGIHGTRDDDSIGHRASHGCVRMHVDDVVDLYDRVPRGTIVHVL